MLKGRCDFFLVAPPALHSARVSVELTEQVLAKMAGWEAVKAARVLLASGKVLSSNFTPQCSNGKPSSSTRTPSVVFRC